MKKIIFFITLLILPLNIYAIDCTDAQLNALKTEAMKSSASYVHNGNNKFSITFDSLTTNFYIEELGTDNVVQYLDNGSSSTIKNYVGGEAYTFYYYGSLDSACPNVLLNVVPVSLPKYNLYSERSECEGIEEYSLCYKWYPGDINEEEFILLTANYKEKKEAEVEEEEEEPEEYIEEEYQETIWDMIMNYLNQKYVMLLVGIALGGIVGIIILKIRRRWR